MPRSWKQAHRALFLLTLAAGAPSAWAETPRAPDETAAVRPTKSATPAAPTQEKTPAPPEEGASSKAPTEEASRAKKDAEERKEAAQLSGKTGLAQRLSALLEAWQRVITAQKTANNLERKAQELQKKNLDLEKQIGRAVTLVEQTEARRARALARLQELGLDAKDALIIDAAKPEGENAHSGEIGPPKGKQQSSQPPAHKDGQQ